MKSTLPTALRLTDQEKTFVRYVSIGKDHEWALTHSHGKCKYPSHRVYDLLSRPNIQAAVILELGRLLRTKAAPKAFKVGIDLLDDESTPPRVKEGLIKTFLDRAGLPAASPAKAESVEDKELNEMSRDELRAHIDRMEAELAARAKPVESARIDKPVAQAVDIFD